MVDNSDQSNLVYIYGSGQDGEQPVVNYVNFNDIMQKITERLQIVKGDGESDDDESSASSSSSLEDDKQYFVPDETLVAVEFDYFIPIEGKNEETEDDTWPNDYFEDSDYIEITDPLREMQVAGDITVGDVEKVPPNVITHLSVSDDSEQDPEQIKDFNIIKISEVESGPQESSSAADIFDQ